MEFSPRTAGVHVVPEAASNSIQLIGTLLSNQDWKFAFWSHHKAMIEMIENEDTFNISTKERQHISVSTQSIHRLAHLSLLKRPKAQGTKDLLKPICFSLFLARVSGHVCKGMHYRMSVWHHVRQNSAD